MQQTRTNLLISATRLSPSALADEIGVHRTTVWRLCNGRRETPPQRKLLDALAREHGLLHLVSDVFESAGAPPSPVTPAPVGPESAGAGEPVNEAA